MNLGQIATAIGQRLAIITSDPTSRDGAAVRSFLTLRHDQLYRSFLWKDSVVEYVLPVDPGATYLPTSNYMPSKGRVILPSIIQHVLGTRYGCRTLNIQRPMIYYSADYHRFMNSGCAREFTLLPPCVWEFDVFVIAVLTISNAADSNLPVTVDYLESDEISVNRVSVQPAFNPDYLNSVNIATTDRVDNILKPITQGQYLLQVFNYGVTFTNSSGFDVDLQLIDESGNQTNFTVLNGATTALYAGVYVQVNYSDTNGSSGTVAGSIAGLFDYTGVFDPTQAYSPFNFTIQSYRISVAQTSDLSFQKCQRIQLVGSPLTSNTASQNLHVLAKRTVPPFSSDLDVPGINGLDGVLFLLAYYDMLQRDERGGTSEAQAALMEAVGPNFLSPAAGQQGKPGGWLGKLIEEEVIQAAYNSRVLPEHGFGGNDDYTWTTTKGDPYDWGQ